MAALAAAARPSSVLAPARAAPRSLPAFPALLPVKPQEYPPLRLSVTVPDGGSNKRRGRGVRGGGRADEASELGGSADLEAEIFEFMQRSPNPRDFPTREELVAAGRADLANAIARQGGWLAFGWDLDEGGEVEGALGSVEKESGEEDSRISQQRVSNGSLRADAIGVADSEASSSGRSMEMEGGEASGIEGILSRLEKERSLAFVIASKEKEVNGRSSRESAEHDPGDIVGANESRRSLSLGTARNFSHSPGDIYSQNGTSQDLDGVMSSMPDMWRTWSLQRSGFPSPDFEAAEIVPSEDEKKTGHAFPVSSEHEKEISHTFSCDFSVDDKLHILTQNAKGLGDEMHELQSDARKSSQNQIRHRLQRLESELTSALQSVRRRSKDTLSDKAQESSLEELHRLSDAWEFQETEIMNARDKLRSIRAKLAVLEGKMALEIIEGQKIMEEKQKRLNAAQKALHLLRTVFIVWPNSASEVLLAGSFDGWTSQRRMERSTTGIFSLYLKLYPGRYEIKFIVDGVWRVDPLRPIVNNNGYQNNLLIVT